MGTAEIPADTTDEAMAVQRSVWRGITPPQRVLVAMQMCDEARQVALAGIARRKPGLSPDARIRELIRLMHSIDVTHATRS